MIGSESSTARSDVQRDERSAKAESVDQRVWLDFQKAKTLEEFAENWLKILCGYIGDVQSAVIVLKEKESGAFRPLVHWPTGTAVSSDLMGAAELALAERRGVIRGDDTQPVNDMAKAYSVAFPLVIDNVSKGVVAIELTRRGTRVLGDVMRQLQWGCGWLEASIRRIQGTPNRRITDVLDLVAVPLEQETFLGAANALATALANELNCEWCAIGFYSGKHARVRAFSHSAAFDEKTDLHRAIGAAMDESIEQERLLVHPPMDDGAFASTRAQARLLEQAELGSVATLPLNDTDRIVGAVVLGRSPNQSFDRSTLDVLEGVGALAGPILDVKRRDDRNIFAKVWTATTGLIGRLIGPRNLGLKLTALALLAVIAFLYFAEGDYRVTADAHLEGSVQRVITAPLDGYINQADFRAGDLVRAGDVMGQLDDTDLRLGLAKAENQLDQRQREYSEALAENDRARVRVLHAQIKQVESQVALLREQLARTRLVAPFDGVVVAGDLSQTLGVPVKRGDTLFAVAPLDSYRVILKVDERDASQIEIGQAGQLVLAGLTGETLAIRIAKITPVSQAEEGKNRFLVEANLEQPSQRVRPGMQGVGKIMIGRRNQGWIWTHKLTYWLRLWLWSWRP